MGTGTDGLRSAAQGREIATSAGALANDHRGQSWKERNIQFITQSTGKKRQMVLLPEVNANTLLLFFEKGNTGYSWSLRDYSIPHRVVERYAHEFGWSAADVRHKARFLFDAPIVDTGQLQFWNNYPLSGNSLLKIQELSGRPTQSLQPPQEVIPTRQPGQFPILNVAALRLLPKATKRGDLERMLCSPNSEDWVTWNLSICSVPSILSTGGNRWCPPAAGQCGTPVVDQGTRPATSGVLA